MYRSLKFSYDSLADKAEISKEQVRFQGFDGNGESQLMGYVNYIINDLGRYKELSDNDLNAGKPRLELYRKMLSRWAKCKDKSKLSKNDLLKIVSAES